MEEVKDNKDLEEVWAKILDDLQAQVSAVAYQIWVEPLKVKDIKNGILYAIAPTAVAKKKCNEELRTEISMAVKDNLPDVTNYAVMLEEEYQAMKNEIQNNEETDEKPLCTFVPHYTFENFVVGKSNQYVYAGAKAVAENPGKRFNPLFIYGGVGLGKTHLLHSIGNELRRTKPKLKVLYATCENFTNDYVQCTLSKEKDFVPFRQKYRNIDVLMIDDIQFIAKRQGTQEEFFNTFNDLYLQGKQIVIASDRKPEEIETLSDRLITRFNGGLTQDIQTPDFETKFAILKKKAEQGNIKVDSEVIDFLAGKDKSIRELESLLNKVFWQANLNGKHQADIEDAFSVMKDDIQSERENLTAFRIIDAVCGYYNVSKDDLTGTRRTSKIADARHISIYLIYDMMGMPLTAIGKIFGKDHSTIAYCRDKIADQLKTNTKLESTISDLKKIINNIDKN